jgi:hypothetical protein
LKRLTVIFSILLAFPLYLFSQEMIENPKKPLSKNAGRVVRLEEVHEITDESGEFYFKHPGNFRVAPNGDFFISDADQLLQFDERGHFIRNLFKKGQGPAEMTSMTDYQLTNEGVLIHCDSPSKIVKFDYDGKLINEIPLHQMKGHLSFLSYYDGQYYFTYIDWKKLDTFEGVVGLPYALISIASDGETYKELSIFRTKSVIAAKGNIHAGAVPVDMFRVVPWQERYLVISHTEEYGINLFDAESNQIVKKFRRKYPRIKATDKKDKRPDFRIIWDGEVFRSPKRKYLYDVEQIWGNGEFLWVLTSATEEGKGYVVDVFDVSCTYIDMFFFNFPEEMTKDYFHLVNSYVSGGYLYTAVKDENDTYTIKKYRISDDSQK